MSNIHQKISSDIQPFGLSNEKIDINLFPDFLIIGPHRSGTSWLYKNLEQHPQVFFPCQKEVNFFCQHDFLRPPTCQSPNDNLKNYLELFRLSFSDE